MTARLTLSAIVFVCGLGFYVHGQQNQPPRATSVPACRIAPGASNPTKIHTLAVRITTATTRGAGTNNAVYFDVGPLAWKLNLRQHDDFEKGATDTYPLLPLPAVKGRQAIQLTTDDILWMRLHKKGIMGVTGLGDGFGGAWHLESITLIVNGSEYCTARIDTSLNSRCWFWRRPQAFDAYADARSFARTLRLEKNERLNWIARVTGLATTPLFKRRGISGWLSAPEEKECSQFGPARSARKPPTVCATGVVIRPPAVSTDGLATIDLQVSKLEFCDDRSAGCMSAIDVTPAEGFNEPRYIRIESKFRGKALPAEKAAVRICGELRWDTDREGWWEIHPRSSADLPPASK